MSFVLHKIQNKTKKNGVDSAKTPLGRAAEKKNVKIQSH